MNDSMLDPMINRVARMDGKCYSGKRDMSCILIVDVLVREDAVLKTLKVGGDESVTGKSAFVELLYRSVLCLLVFAVRYQVLVYLEFVIRPILVGYLGLGGWFEY